MDIALFPMVMDWLKEMTVHIVNYCIQLH